jgi:hypothetical protein
MIEKNDYLTVIKVTVKNRFIVLICYNKFNVLI